MTKEELKPTMAADQNENIIVSSGERSEQIRAGADEIINKLVDNLIKENEELKEEIKELKEKYIKTKDELNEMLFNIYGICPETEEK